MMASKIRVGIVGATVTPGGSGWGARAHVPAVHALPEYELKAVCTAHEETAIASKEAFNAELGFSNFEAMVSHPDIDLIAVVVRVPGHYDLVMAALEAGKDVFCEWPLGANLAQAEEMARLASESKLRTAVGLQARSNPAYMFARELVQDGYVGEVVSARFSGVGEATINRGNGRIWQGDRKNGANTLTITSGHSIDALNFVLGDFEEVTARLATRITEWHNTDTGETMQVDSPDWISVSGRLEGGGEVSFLTTTVPHHPSGQQFEIYGREGTLVVKGDSPNTGSGQVYGARGDEPLAPMETPERFQLAPKDTPSGSPLNVAQAYVRIARAWETGEPFKPDFADAVKLHSLIADIERSAEERRTVRL
jgi:predicted dehydrogenase